MNRIIREHWLAPLVAAASVWMLACETTGAPAPDAVTRGKSIYTQVCAKCHGGDGKGGGYKNLTPPPSDLTAATVQNKLDASLYKSIHEGRKDTAMGAWKFALTDQEIADVLAYVRQLGSRNEGKLP